MFPYFKQNCVQLEQEIIMVKTHPNIKKDEVFLGNTTIHPKDDKYKHLKTYKHINEAYDIYGKRLPEHFYATVINRNELEAYNRIMMDSMKASLRDV